MGKVQLTKFFAVFFSFVGIYVMYCPEAKADTQGASSRCALYRHSDQGSADTLSCDRVHPSPQVLPWVMFDFTIAGIWQSFEFESIPFKTPLQRSANSAREFCIRTGLSPPRLIGWV